MPVLQHCVYSEPLSTRCCRLLALELFLGQSEKLHVNPKETLTPVWGAPEYEKLNSSPDPQPQPVHLRTATVSSSALQPERMDTQHQFFFPLFCFSGVLLKNLSALGCGSSGSGKLNRREKSLQGTRKLLFCVS